MPDHGPTLLRTYLAVWDAADTAGEPGGTRYARRHQRENGARLRAFVDALLDEARRPRKSVEEPASIASRLKPAFVAFACGSLGWDAERLEPLLQAFPAAMNAFRDAARAFDAGLAPADIYQAARNAVTMYCLQSLLGLEVALTPSVLGYSLLYPYTDNFLDDPRIEPGAKHAFGERFRARLAGEELVPESSLEHHVFGLIEMIERQHPRAARPHVYRSLLDIHAAQQRSLALLARPTPRDVVAITFEKGGLSVVADGYLVGGGRLTAAQEECLYGLGVFLQLRDDLEDMTDDRQRTQATVFSSLPDRTPLDEVTARTLAIGQAVLARLDAFDDATDHGSRPQGHGVRCTDDGPGRGNGVRDLMVRGLLLTVADAAASVATRYRRGYLERLEACSPVPFSVLTAERRRVSRARGSFSTMLEIWLAHA